MEKNKTEKKQSEKKTSSSSTPSGVPSAPAGIPSEEGKEGKKQIAIIRISGQVKVSKDIENTLYRLKLRRKYSCVVVKPTKDILGMIKKVRFYVAYGEINKDIYDKLIKERGKKDKQGKLKSFFRLHPPRKGIKSKLQYPKGVLGNNKDDINKLIERML